jgi:hypothetical protein
MSSSARIVSIALVLAAPGLAHASSDAAWSEFAKQVQEKCTAATADIFRRSFVAVDPTGTESFGVAIVYGRAKAAKAPAAVICVMDKKTGKVEIGSELGPDLVRVRKPKPAGADPAKDQKQTGQQAAPASGTSGDDDDDQQ